MLRARIGPSLSPAEVEDLRDRLEELRSIGADVVIVVRADDRTVALDLDAVLPDVIAMNLGSKMKDRLEEATESGVTLRAFTSTTSTTETADVGVAGPFVPWGAFAGVFASSSGAGAGATVSAAGTGGGGGAAGGT